MLGKQAEYYFQQYLEASQRYKLVAHNIQIHGSTETLGELDYLVYDQMTKHHCHIELACKFYLYDARMSSEYKRWIGQNRKDSLYDKINKLASKQFQMLFASETKPTLTTLEIDSEKTIQQLCLKAFLFLPKGMEVSSLSESFRKCVVGEWLHWDDFRSENNSDTLYAIPEKKQWLDPPENYTNWRSYSEIKKTIETNKMNRKATLVYAKTNEAIRLFFIVCWH